MMTLAGICAHVHNYPAGSMCHRCSIVKRKITAMCTMCVVVSKINNNDIIIIITFD